MRPKMCLIAGVADDETDTFDRLAECSVMTPPPPTAAQGPVNLTPLIAAVESGDRAATLAALGDPLPAEAWEWAGRYFLQTGRFVDASRVLGRVLDPDAPTRRRLTLARNLAALAKHRPELVTRIDPRSIAHAAAGEDADATFVIADTPSGLQTIVHRPPAGPPVSMSPGNEPRAALAHAMQQLAPLIEQRTSLGVYGLGDGYLLAALGECDTPSELGQRQCVHVIAEDDAHLVTALCLHDYAGPRGPIAQPRFRFYLGSDWSAQMAAAFAGDPMLPFPATGVAHGAAGNAIQPRVQKLAADVTRRAEQLAAANTAHYASVDTADLAAVFGDDPPRPPRVLAITCRYTTVLQHSTRDALAAFDALGCETHLLIEPADDHLITPVSIAAAIAQFKPDLVFLIDHLRYEYADRFPPQLPMTCWIQDHLANLTHPSVGPRVGLRDYVFTSIAPRYVNQSNYPARQMIDLPKLTRTPQRPATWSTDGDDLVYVSNASQPIDVLTDASVEATGDDPAMRRFVRTCCDSIVGVYEQGDALATFADVRRVVVATVQQTAAGVSPEAVSLTVQHLHQSFNSALYRRQALRWARDIAADRGLSLGVYGNGWERLDEFASHARGPVDYGPDLEALTRRTRINLQIVPFLCTHQRLLDGLVAGGFFLVRSHPWDQLLSEVAAFLDAHGDPSIATTDGLRASVAADRRAELDGLLERAATVADIGYAVDLIEQVRCYQRARHIDADAVLLPRLEDVSFNSADQLAARVDRYLDDPDARTAVATEQRESVERRLTYTAGMARVIQAIHRLLTDELT